MPKRAASYILDSENFGILDGTKHTHKKIGIVHFVIPKYLVFCIFAFYRELNTT